MTAFPAAYCSTCGTWLSPQGSMKAAREARRNHRDNRRTFEGIQHTAAVYENRADFEREVVEP